MSVILATKIGEDDTVVMARDVKDKATLVAKGFKSPLLAEVRFTIAWFVGERLVCCPFFSVEIPSQLVSCRREFRLLLKGDDPQTARVFLVEVDSGVAIEAKQKHLG